MIERNKENTIYIDDGRKTINFEIGTTNYSTHISIRELLKPNIDIDDGFDYRYYVSSQLIRDINKKQTLTVEQVKSQSDSFFI